MTEIALSNEARLALDELKERRPPDRYTPEVLKELRYNGFIVDVSGGWITINKRGLDYLFGDLLPAAATLPAVKPSHSGTPSKARTLPVEPKSTPPKARPVLITDPAQILRALEAAGGTATVDQLGAHGSTLRKMERAGQIAYDGITATLIEYDETPPVEPPAVTPSILQKINEQTRQPIPHIVAASDPPDEPEMFTKAWFDKYGEGDHLCADSCATCFNKRALDYLMQSSSKVRAIVERFADQERSRQQLDDAVRALFNK